MSKARLLLTAEVADRLGVSTRQVARLVESGDIQPAFRAPGRRGAFGFDPDDVDKLVAERRPELEEREAS